MLTPVEYEKITALTHTLSDMLLRHNISLDALNDITVTSISLRASEIAKRTVTVENTDKLYRDRKIDNILVNKWTGIPVMFLLLAAIFWITIAGANYPSSFLMEQLFRLEDTAFKFAPGHVVCKLLVVKLLGGAGDNKLTVSENGEPFGDFKNLVQFMAYEQNCDTLCCELEDNVEQRLYFLFGKGGRRLIHDDKLCI